MDKSGQTELAYSKSRSAGMKLSVVLATYNESANLKASLASIKDIATEIIVIDGQSSDDTRKIAKSFGAKVFVKPNPAIFHINKQIALEKAKFPWILQLDADEKVDKTLKSDIKKVISHSHDINGFYLKRKNFFLSRWLRKGGQYPDSVIRLVKNGKAHFPQKSVHEQIKVDGNTATLNGHLLHYTAPTLARYLENSNRYTSLTARKLQQQKVLFSGFSWTKYLLLKPISTFLSLYFRHKGAFDGFPGFIFALFSGLHWPIAFMKYWELKNVSR